MEAGNSITRVTRSIISLKWSLFTSPAELRWSPLEHNGVIHALTNQREKDEYSGFSHLPSDWENTKVYFAEHARVDKWYTCRHLQVGEVNGCCYRINSNKNSHGPELTHATQPHIPGIYFDVWMYEAQFRQTAPSTQISSVVILNKEIHLLHI